MTRTLALLLTMLTGFTGLVYEVTWQKGLAILLGSHAEATAAVLAIFLGGLSLGYAVFGRLSRHRGPTPDRGAGAARLLLVYGAVEAAIGLWALAFPPLFAAARSASVWLPFRHDPAAFAADVMLTALLIAPPTVLMGGTIPLLTQALARDLTDATRFHALVYGCNAAGGFAGALAAAFVLVPRLGIPGTLAAMGSLNLLAGAAFACLGVWSRTGLGSGAAPAGGNARVEGFAFFAGAALLLGFAMMAIQTVLIRVGGLAFGASHFTFAMVVAVFVLCIATGSLAVSALGRIPRGAAVLCPVLLAASLAALYPAVDHAPWAAHLVRSLFRDVDLAFYPFYATALLGILVVLAIPVGLSGASLPLLFHELRRSHGELGSVAGRLYSWNTVGNLLGSLLGGYALLHWLDLHHVYRVGVAAVAAAAGLLLARLYPVRRSQLALGGVVVLAGLVALPAWAPERMAAGLFRLRQLSKQSLEGPDAMRPNSRRILFHDDDPTTTVTVESHPQAGGPPSLSILTNGKPDGSLAVDYPTMALVALLPCLIVDSCRSAFVIGFGTGVTVGELGALESVESIVVAEISSAVIEAAPLFDRGNQAASRNPKVRFERGDAYRTLLRDGGPYDVIASEPPNPWVAGVEMLYGREFLEAARARLRPGGVYAQWIHTYEIDRASLELVLRTFDAVFDRVAVWYALGNDLLLLGLMPDAAPDLARIESRMRRPDFSSGLHRAGIDSLPALLAHEILPLGVVHAAALPGDVQTLLHPRLSDRAARAFFVGRSAELPPIAAGAAAEVGRRSSLLGTWIAREGAFAPQARRAVAEELCEGYRRPECLTALAAWKHAEPHSVELAATLERFAGAARERDEIETLATFFDDGPQGPVTPERARSLAARFGRYYYHAIPFERAALEAIWRRCRGADCGSTRRAAGALVGEIPSDVAGR